MGSGFDNSIYWIISHAKTTIRYYIFKIAVSMAHKQLTLSRLTHQLLICLERCLPDESSRTVFTASYICSARATHRKHINWSATDIMYCCQACPPMHSSNGRPIVAHSLLWYRFTCLFPSNGRPSIVWCTLVGTCLTIRRLETAQYITVFQSYPKKKNTNPHFHPTLLHNQTGFFDIST
jgi:hypothetical protein